RRAGDDAALEEGQGVVGRKQVVLNVPDVAALRPKLLYQRSVMPLVTPADAILVGDDEPLDQPSLDGTHQPLELRSVVGTMAWRVPFSVLEAVFGVNLEVMAFEPSLDLHPLARHVLLAVVQRNAQIPRSG